MTNEELVELYQSGDEQALNELMEKNTGMVRKLANKFYTEKTNSIDIEDLQQEGFIGLITAARKYDFDNAKRAKFITYAVYWIHQKMNMFIKSKNTNDEISINVPVGETKDTEFGDSIKDENNLYENVEDKIYNLQLRKELEEVMVNYNTLNEREILKLRYGWDNNKCMSCEEVGEIFNVTG
ncbi:sigma-70 family RNA polymerase sigma factor [Clostridium sp. WILCCON 0269]|uniref:Sigma-70 family RNA polymerase sigma factor n=1 Tax=Candidatus Clostridium eludens TaxID=3381663 RepID=A0ABW8SQJ1_9CLOT